VLGLCGCYEQCDIQVIERVGEDDMIANPVLCPECNHALTLTFSLDGWVEPTKRQPYRKPYEYHCYECHDCKIKLKETWQRVEFEKVPINEFELEAKAAMNAKRKMDKEYTEVKTLESYQV
jgi:uncharacterized CHY-type Zn-finger protein